MDLFCRKHGISLKESEDFGRGFYVTKKIIKASTIIWNESPISYALKQGVCHYCWKKPEQSQLYRCGNCKFARYCSKHCQSEDWKQSQSHKIRCKAISKLNGKLPTVTIVAIAELLTNIQPSSNNKIQKKKSSLIHLQQSLISTMIHHWDEKTEDEKSDMNQVSLCIALYMKALHETLQSQSLSRKKKKTGDKDYQTEEFKVDMNEINMTLGIFSTNAISICDDEFNTFGIGLFPLLSMMNHSCDPNVMVKFNPCTKTAEIRALRDIKQNEQLFINYTDITVPKFMRQQALKKDYCFECKCTFCDNKSNVNEQLCIDLCCVKCGDILDGCLVDVYQCKNKKCGKKYAKYKLRQIVDDTESEYYEIKKDVEAVESGIYIKKTNLLKQCNDCLLRIDKIVGKYHWLRISLLKIKEKLQLNLNDFEGCYESNVLILEFYEKWLSPYSPYLGIQYCLTGKLLNYLIHDKCNDVYSINNCHDTDNENVDEDKKRELLSLCDKACKMFNNGLKILRVSHGDTLFVHQLTECEQTAKFNLRNVCR